MHYSADSKGIFVVVKGLNGKYVLATSDGNAVGVSANQFRTYYDVCSATDGAFAYVDIIVNEIRIRPRCRLSLVTLRLRIRWVLFHSSRIRMVS